MKKSLLLSAALAAVILPLAATEAYAQGVAAPQANTRAARKARDAAQNAATNAAPTWPKATREAPKQSGAPAVKKQLDALFALQQKNDSEDEIIKRADELIANGSANAFDKSSAAYLAASAWQSKGASDYANAISYYRKAIEFNGLHNNIHYQAMLQLAQLLDADNRSAEALTTVEQFLAETHSDDSQALGLKTQILLTMNKPEVAIPFLEQQVAAKPGDKKLAMNLAGVYQAAGQEAKALAVLEKLHKAGMFSEAADYDSAWRLYANSEDGDKQAMALIEEGLAKGILKPSAEVYAFQAQTWYAAGDTEKAIAAWNKGAPLSSNGQSYLNLAQVLVDKERYAEAKAAAHSGLDKGVKKPGNAWQVIGQAEEGLGNKAGALAAYREAAKYPETKKWAESELRRASGK